MLQINHWLLGGQTKHFDRHQWDKIASCLTEPVKILGEYLDENKIKLIPQDSDDLYYLYNTISEGDIVESKTSRKMKDTGDRITVWMRITVEEVEFHGFGETIRIRGKIQEASDENISLGSYHAITVEFFQEVVIIKPQGWKSSELNRLRSAQMGESSPLVVVAMDDEAALVTQVGSHASKILLDLDPGIPRKGHDPQGHYDATQSYFKELAHFLRLQREEGIAQYIVVGGPGFTKDAFYDYLKIQHHDLIQDLMIVNTNSPGRAGIREIISSKIPQNFLAGQAARQQAKLMGEVMERLGKDTNELAYGSDIKKATEMGAVDTLLVLDTQLHQSVERRHVIEELISAVEQMGGRTILMSASHDESTKDILDGFGGMIALLRFPLPK